MDASNTVISQTNPVSFPVSDGLTPELFHLGAKEGVLVARRILGKQEINTGEALVAFIKLEKGQETDGAVIALYCLLVTQINKMDMVHSVKVNINRMMVDNLTKELSRLLD